MNKRLPLLCWGIAVFVKCHAQLLSSFTASDTAGCAPLQVTFTNLSAGNPAHIKWSFGNGDTSSAQNPTEIFPDTGYYRVTLVISNGASVDSSYLFIRVFPAPQISFSISSTFSQCPPFPAQFFNNSPDTAGSWFWKFGDGDTSTSSSALHIYLFPGRYNVTLNEINYYGCTGSKTDTSLITVRGPIGNFTEHILRDSCSSATVVFSGTESSTSSSIISPGDGPSFLDSIPLSYIYNSSGTFYPIITLTDSFNCTVAYALDSIHVLGATGTFNDEIPFDSCTLVIVDFSAIASWYTSYVLATGDGHTFDSLNITYAYTRPGIYYPTYTLTDTFCTSTFALYPVYVDSCSAAGINTYGQKNAGFNIFPNPAKDFINVTPFSQADFSLELQDITGNKLLTQQSRAEIQINVSELASGPYILKLEYPALNEFYTKKVIVTH